MAMSTKMRNDLPNSSFAMPQVRKFPLKKIENGRLVPSPANISSAKGYIRYASPSGARKINSAYNSMHQGGGGATHSTAVARAVANGHRSLASMMRK